MYWAFLPALVWLLWHWATTRDWRAGAVWMAFLAGWGVWLQNTRRTGFLFYMTPLMPFLVLGLTLAVGTLLPAARTESIAEPSAPAAAGREPDCGRMTGATGDDGPDGRPARVDRRCRASRWTGCCGSALVALWLGAVVADFVWMWPIFTGGMLTNHAVAAAHVVPRLDLSPATGSGAPLGPQPSDGR